MIAHGIHSLTVSGGVAIARSGGCGCGCGCNEPWVMIDVDDWRPCCHPGDLNHWVDVRFLEHFLGVSVSAPLHLLRH